MNELFKRITWAEFQDNKNSYKNCKVLYITDKDLYCIRYDENNYVIYSQKYGQCNFSYADALSNPELTKDLSPGMYIFNNNDLYYYTGTNWVQVGTSGSSGESNPSFTIWSTHVEYGAAGYEQVSDAGNLQIKGYIEGQINGGAW